MKQLEQPDVVWKNMLGEVMNAEPTEFTFRGKKKMMGWIHKKTYLKFERLMVYEEDAWKRNVKIAALILMNVKSGFWSMMRTCFYYPIYWRWLYYIVDVDMADVLNVLDVSKKKIPSTAFFLTTTLSTVLMDEIVAMTTKREEVKAGEAVPSGGSSSH